MEPQRVARRTGTANMEGELYEVGMATLLFLRGYFRTSDFSLNVNVDGAGAFDDVIFDYRQQSGARRTTYMQLKHKQNPEKHTINTHALCAKTGDFSLIHYFDSFCEIRQRYDVKDADQFVIYTNARLGNINDVQNPDYDSLLSTGGEIISLENTKEQDTAFKLLEPYKDVLNGIRKHDQYTEKEIKEKLTPFAKISHCQRLLKSFEGKKVSIEDKMAKFYALLKQQITDELNAQVWQCFIAKLRLFVSQVSVKDLDNLIKENLRNYLGTDTDRFLLDFKNKMTEWWSKEDVTLSHKHAPFWVDGINDLISDLAAPVINRLSPISEIVFMEKLELSAKVSQIVTESCTELSCLQVQQSLKDVGHFIVDYNTLASRTDEVLLKWRFLDWCTVLIVEGSLDNSVTATEKIDNIITKVCDILQSTKKRIISISNKCEDSFIANLSNKFKVQVHHENFNLSLLDEKSIVRILDCEVDFQGIPVKLGTLADNPKTREAVKANLLLALLSKEGPIKIGECLPKPGPNYVARTLYRKECVRKNILQDNVFPKLAVSGLSKEQLRRLIGVGDQIEPFHENINSVDNSSRYFIIKGAEDFNSLCNKYNDIHWIHWSDERFIWMHSNGPLEPIAEHLEDVQVKYDKIESFVNLSHKVVLILGEPGMGKSEELKSLASQLKVLDESTWVVRVVLNDCTEDLSKDQIDVTELLLKAANIRSEIGKMLFDYQLKIGGNIIVLFDGLDEINPIYTEKVNSMIEYLLTKKVKKIWLTSRPIMWGILEKQFCVLPFRLFPLTKNEQMNLLPKLWTYTESCGKDQTDFEKHATMFAEKLLQMTDTTLKDSSIFLSIPLHLMMLAEVLKSEVVESCKNGELDLPIRLDLLKLYSDFVGIKWDLYCEKMNLDRKVPGIAKVCASDKRLTEDKVMNSAMVTLFGEDIKQLRNAKQILDMNSEFLSKLDSGEEMVGLVTHAKNGKAVFVHRTFAEYFAAIWFSKNYLSNLVYFRQFYLSGSFETVRMFFDRILAREKILHTCVLSCNIDEITTFLGDNNADIDEMDRSGRTALHLAVTNFLNLVFNRINTTKNNIAYHNFDLDLLPIPVRQGFNQDVTYLLQIVKLLLKKDADCSITDNILYWTPLEFAENNRIWCLLDLLLEYYPVSPGDLSVIQDKILDQNFLTNVLEAAAVDECVNVIQLIFDYEAYNSTFCCFPYERTLLHVAAFLGHLKLTEYLIERGADLEVRDMFGITPLMASSLNHNHDVTIMLLEQGADPNATCNKGRSAIHFAFHRDSQANAQFRPDIDKEYKSHDLGIESSFTAGILILLKHGANPNVGDTFGHTLDNYARWTNLKYVIDQMLELDINISDVKTHLATERYKNNTLINLESDSNDLLHSAIDAVTPNNNQQILDDYKEKRALTKDKIWENPEKAIDLLKHRANPNAKDEYGNTPIHYAAENKWMNVVECLLELECDVDCTNTEGETPLLKAIKRRNEEIAIKLIQRGANPNAKDKYGNTPIHYAAEKELTNVVECLLELICDIDCTNKNGETPLLKAIKRRNEEMSIKLLNHGANPNAKDENGNSLMHYAVKFNLVNTVDLLLKLECDYDGFNKKGKTPLLEAVMGRNQQLAIKLLWHGANPNAKDEDDNSVMHYAVFFNLTIVIPLLRSLKCDFDGFNKKSETLLLEAVKGRNEGIAIKLLNIGANPDAKDKEDNSVMHLAVAFNLTIVIDLLLSLKCDLEGFNTKGKTPLFDALEERKQEIAIKLLKHGANPNARDLKGNTPLHYAAEKELTNVVECLLELKCDIDCTTKYGETPLLEAIKQGNEEISMKLLKHGANPNAKNKYGNTPIHYAVKKQLMKVVECILELKCDIDCTNTEGETPLIIAITRRNEEMAIKLLKQGANPNAKDRHGNSVMHLASEKNLVMIVDLLLSLECDVDGFNEEGETLLLEAVMGKNEEIAIKFLKHGTNPNAKDNYGNTPMHYAAGKELTNVVECLLELKCNFDCTNTEGETPLLKAIKQRNEEIAIKLLKLGANPNTMDKYGNTVMHFAAEGNLAIAVDMLLKLECDFDSLNEEGVTPLLEAVMGRNEEIAIKLLKCGSNPKAKDKYGNTPMHYSAGKELMKVVEYLLELKCDFDCTNTEGETPLLKAIKRKDEEMAIKLLNLGANPHLEDKYGNSVMHFAAEGNLPITVDMLLKLKCKFDSLNEEGITPLLSAIKRRHEEIAIKLLKHGANPNALTTFGNSVMHFAAAENFVMIVDLLLSLKCDFDNLNKEGETPLLKAIKWRNEEIAIKLLMRGANPNLEDKYGNTVMHFAVVENLAKTVDFLLKLECDFDSLNNEGKTPLLKAIMGKHEEIAIKLLKRGANPNAKDKYGNTPIHYAAEMQLTKVVECLLELKCYIDCTNAQGETPLLKAITQRNEEIAIKLLKLGANPNAKDRDGDTPMHYAAEENLMKVVECLLELECDIDCTNIRGATPLFQAIRWGYEEIAIKLLKHGSNPKANDKYGNTPMHYATEDNLMKVVECLLELKCYIDCTNAQGVTPLLIAIKRGNEEIAIKLLKLGANPNAKDRHGDTPMHYAAEKNLMKVVECLLELECDIDCTNIQMETPLLNAIRRGNEEIAIKLLKHGANPKSMEIYGGRPSTMKVKLDFDCTYKEGETPLLETIKRRNEEMASMEPTLILRMKSQLCNAFCCRRKSR